MQHKFRKKFFVYLLSLFLISALITPNLSAQAAGFVIRPSSLDGWSWRTDSGSLANGPRRFEVGPAAPPLGTGSFHIELDDAATGVSMGIQKYGGTPLANISALSYSTYRTAPAGQTTITLQIAYDPDLTATVGGFGKPFYGYLVYEPYQNGLTVSNNVWQTWDAINGGSGRWWATPNSNSLVDDVCGQSSPCTWSYILSQYPNIGIHPGSLAFNFNGSRRIQLKAGSNWNGFRGNADGLHITINGVEDVYDFEPDLPTPTPTLTSTATFTPTFTPTDVPTFTPTFTPTDVPTFTPTFTPTDVPTFTPTFTPTDVPTFTPTATFTPTDVPTFTSTFTPSNTPTPSALPIVLKADSLPDTGDAQITENEIISISLNNLIVHFNKDMYNPSGNSAPDDATNPNNYLLLRSVSGTFATVSCLGGVQSPDVQIPITSVSYANGGGSGPFVATLSVNPSNLINGFYRLVACGTTSLTDLGGTELAGNGATSGTDFARNFLILVGGGSTPVTDGNPRVSNKAVLPKTGFAPGKIADLGAPSVKYASTSLTLELPRLKLKLPIVGVPFQNGGWDVSWLTAQTGWLEHTAYPGFTGNSVLTSHVVSAYGAAGPFANLNKSVSGDIIFVRNNGTLYIYQVDKVFTVAANDTSIFKHEEKAWLTLITCDDYDEQSGVYLKRLVVRARLLGEQADPSYRP